MDTRDIRERLLSIHPSPDSSSSEPASVARFSGPNQALQQLTQMGFSPAACERAIAFSGSDRVDDLLNYLLEGPRGWEHEFIPQEDDQSLCLFCNDIHSKHTLDLSPASPVVSEERPMPLLVEHLNSYQAPGRGSHCGICYSHITAPWSLPGDDETHVFCRACIEDYLQVQITEGKVDKIPCPGVVCNRYFQGADVEGVVPSELFAKYERFQLRNSLMKNPNLRWCCQPNCSGYMEGNEAAPQMSCPVCHSLQCFLCGSPWHEGKTCDQTQDHAYLAWAHEHEVQLCPKCKRPVEKNAGCNHMTCTICHYEFCWLCGGHYTAGHFSSMNPFGCAGLQSGNVEKRNWPRWRIYLRRVCLFLLWILIVALFPLVLLLVPAIYATAKVYRHNREMNSCGRVTLAVMIFVTMLLLTPLGAALILPSLCLICIWRTCRRLAE